MIDYDYLMTLFAEQAKDIILVGDYMGKIVMGSQGTVPVTLSHLYPCKSVRKKAATNQYFWDWRQALWINGKDKKGNWAE